MADPGQERHTPVWQGGLSLAVVAAVSTTMLAGIYSLTRDDIAEQQRRVVLEQLEQIIPAGEFDNELHEDLIRIRHSVHFPGDQEVVVFRARRENRPVAVVMQLIAKDGYNGDIGLLVGIRYSGRISGVRVTKHRETPGLGDDIEIRRSDWIKSFDDRSLNDPAVQQWAVRRDRGDFDQFTGATITPRAVVRAVRSALEYFDANRDQLFQLNPDEVSGQ
jgi:electron transport complex protein RnfG